LGLFPGTNVSTAAFPPPAPEVATCSDSNVIGGVTAQRQLQRHRGVYRVDRADDLNWLADEFGAHLR